MGQPFLSQISLWGLDFAVRDWAYCDGQDIPIAQNTALFALLGARYGGDARTTFGLPNLKGRMACGLGNPGEDRGSTGGAETVTLNAATMPQHNHPGTILTVADTAGTSGPASGLVMAKPSVTRGGTTAVGSSFSDQSYVSAAVSSGLPETGSIGSGTPFSVRSPYLAVSYEIAIEGIFPARA